MKQASNINKNKDMGTLEKLAKEIKELGYEVYGYKSKDSDMDDFSSIYVGKKGKKEVGYVSRDFDGFYTIGRAYKPSLEFGYGVVIVDGLLSVQMKVEKVLNIMEFKIPKEWKDIREWYAYERKFRLFEKV